MTLVELIAKARDCAHNAAPDSAAAELGEGVLDLLAEAAPCGWDPPDIVLRAGNHPRIGIPNAWAEDYVDTDDGRAFARMILAACDEADKLKNGAKQ